MNLRTLDALLARGESFLEARRNPPKAPSLFADFSDAYHCWNAAGRDLITRLSGPSAAKIWGSGGCRAMYSLALDPVYSIREQERQQAMLLELRARLGAATAVARPGTPPSAPVKDSMRGERPSMTVPMPARAIESADDRLYVLRPDGRDLTNEELLEDLRRVAKALGKNTITFTEYPRHGRCGTGIFLARFGTWNNAVHAAGLEVVARRNIPTEELLENLARVWQALGRQPTQGEMVRPLSAFSTTPYSRRFGSWLRALRAFAAWANEGKSPEEAGAPRSAAPPKTPRAPNVRLRFAVLQRDSFKCTACGRSPVTEPATRLHVDHKIPWSRGGRTTLENLATLCEKCNLGKSNSDCRLPVARTSSSPGPGSRGQAANGRGRNAATLGQACQE